MTNPVEKAILSVQRLELLLFHLGIGKGLRPMKAVTFTLNYWRQNDKNI